MPRETPTTIGFASDAGRELISPYKKPDHFRPIAKASAVSVRLLSACVGRDYDGFGRRDNDVAISSATRADNEPAVRRVHFYEAEIPQRTALDVFDADIVFVEEDFDQHRLRVRVDVDEIDRSLGEREEIREAFTSLMTMTGAIFPVALPYAFAAKTVTKLVDKLAKHWEENDHVLSLDIDLWVGNPGVGRAALQEGYYVALSGSHEDISKFRLRDDGRLDTAAAPDVSYCVVEVTSSFLGDAKSAIGQKQAKLLSQLKEGDENKKEKGTLEFLKETMEGYSSFRKLERYTELNTKANRTPKEDARLLQLRSDSAIREYLNG